MENNLLNTNKQHGELLRECCRSGAKDISTVPAAKAATEDERNRDEDLIVVEGNRQDKE